MNPLTAGTSNASSGILQSLNSNQSLTNDIQTQLMNQKSLNQMLVQSSNDSVPLVKVGGRRKRITRNRNGKNRTRKSRTMKNRSKKNRNRK